MTVFGVFALVFFFPFFCSFHVCAEDAEGQTQNTKRKRGWAGWRRVNEEDKTELVIRNRWRWRPNQQNVHEGNEEKCRAKDPRRSESEDRAALSERPLFRKILRRRAKQKKPNILDPGKKTFDRVLR